MPDESPTTFDEIKPFLRMLEGSIDEARARRLASEGGAEPTNSSGHPGEPIPPASASAGPQNLGHSPTVPTDTAIGNYRPVTGEASALQATPKRSQPENRASSLARPNYRM